MVRAWRAGGQAAQSYCSQQRISRESLRRWVAEVDATSSPPPAATFVRLQVATPPSEMAVHVGQARIVVRRGFDPALLRDVVRALGEVSA